MYNYLQLLEQVFKSGLDKKDRTGTGCRSLLGQTLRFDLSRGFPLITTKKVHWKSILIELLWFLRGEGNITFLKENGVSIWDEWADKNGNLGPVYGVQWIHWNNSINQIQQLMVDLKAELNGNVKKGRQHVITAWNPSDIDKMALPPCHMFFQVWIQENKLSLLMYQRSCDLFLGVPFNIASYSLLTHMLARCLGIEANEFIWVGGDCHIYSNHHAQVEEQLLRTPLKLPTLTLNENIKDIFKFTPNDITLNDYVYHPPIRAQVSV
mgnify:FL=1